MTLNDLVVRVKDRSHKGDPVITSDAITAQIIRGIEDARRDLIRYVPKQYSRKDALLPLVVTDANILYSLAADVMEPIIFRYILNDVNYVLQRITSEREYYLNLFIQTQAPNRPFFYVEKGLDALGNRQIEIYPRALPATIFNVEYAYYKDLTKTTLTTADLNIEFPDFPSYIQDALWKGSLYYFLKNFDDAQMLEIASRDYEVAKVELDKIEEEDQDLDIVWRFGLSRSLYRDETTGIRLQ